MDGSKSYNKAKISNVRVDNKYIMESNSHYEKIKIGDENEKLTGYQNYEISYTYDIGNDKSKEFDESKLGFSRGLKGSTDSSSIIYNVNDKIINGEFTGVLEAREGLTIRLELPEGYFLKRIDPIKIFAIILSIFYLLISFVVWNCLFYSYTYSNKVYAKKDIFWA